MKLTVVYGPPERCPATAFEIEFFSATQRILPGMVLGSRVKPQDLLLDLVAIQLLRALKIHAALLRAYLTRRAASRIS